jgi:GNAT superfamily N-acetyltransferase
MTYSVRPAHEATWEDLEAVFGTRGPASRCWCQRYRLAPGEAFGSFPAEERAARLRDQTDCGNPGSGTTSGLVAYDVARDSARPVGWCAVAPRSSYDGLVRVFRVPWEGRDEDRDDDSVWAVTCLLVRTGHRKQEVSRALAVAAVEHARAHGARAIEAYPVTRTDLISEELHVGTVATFAAAGLVEVTRPGSRRAVMRLDF